MATDHNEDLIIRKLDQAYALIESGQLRDAENILAEVIQSDPWNITAKTNLAELLFIQGKLDEAISVAEQAFDQVLASEKYQNHAVLFLNLSLYLMIKDPYKAIKITRAGREKFPENWEIMHNHAEVCRLIALDKQDQGQDIATALKHGVFAAEKALSYMPDDTPLRVTYAGLLRLSGRREKFIPYLNQLLSDVGDRDVATRVLFIDALLDEKSLERASNEIDELSKLNEFHGLLESQKKRLAELIKGSA